MPSWTPWSTVYRTAKAALRHYGWDYAGFPEARAKADDLFPGFGMLISPIEEGTPDPEEVTREAGEPEFRLARLSRAVLRQVAVSLQKRGLDLEIVERVVRAGCRGHRNFRDAEGNEIPCQLESTPEGTTRLSRRTWEIYLESRVALALMLAIAVHSGLPVPGHRGGQHGR